MLTKHHKEFCLPLKEILLLLIPFLVWAFLFKDLLLAESGASPDAQANFFKIKYFVDNISRGVYPLWNPFAFWGMPDNFDVRFFGEYNPLIYIIALLNILGIPFKYSYGLFLSLFYFIGLSGFYLLAKLLFKRTGLAFMAYIMVLFSSLGVLLFTDPVLALINCPTGWFFYFLLSLVQNQRKQDLMGLTFTLMIMAITYLPFYSLTLVITTALFSFPLYIKNIKPVSISCWQTLKGNKAITLLCLLALGLALVPGIMWLSQNSDNQTIYSPFRHEGAISDHPATVGLRMINLGGVGSFQIEDLFSFLSHAYMTKSVYFFIPIIVFVFILISVANAFNKRLFILLSSTLLLLMISLGKLTPVHTFLYHNVFFFQLFRNISAFFYATIPLIVLFSVEQLRLFLAHKATGILKLFIVLLLWGMLSAGAFFLNYQFENISLSVYITLLATAVLLTFYINGFFIKDRRLFFACLGLVIVIQPTEAFYTLSRNLAADVPPQEYRREYPQFSYLRPLKNEDGHLRYASAAKPKKVMQDASGFAFYEDHYVGTAWSFTLQNHIDHRQLQSYVQHKFILYDRCELADASESQLVAVVKGLHQNMNTAYIFDAPRGQNICLPVGKAPREAEYVTQSSESFEVLSFDLNHIRLRTNFPSRKFLVYNDSFAPDWQAFVNGKRVPLYRANIAFKGLWLEAGDNIVLLRYHSPWRYCLHIFLIIFYNAFFIILISSFIRLKVKPR